MSDIVDRIIDAITRFDVVEHASREGTLVWAVRERKPTKMLVRFRSEEFEHAKARCDRMNAIGALAVMRAHYKTARARSAARRWCNAKS